MECLHYRQQLIAGAQWRQLRNAARTVVFLGGVLLSVLMSAQQKEDSQALSPPLTAALDTAAPAETASPISIQPLGAAVAEKPPELKPMPSHPGSFEFGAGYSTMTAGFNAANEMFVRADIAQNSKTDWNVDASRAQQFQDTGYLFFAGVTRDFSSSLYGDLHMGGSSGGYFLPAFTFDGSLHKKWMSEKQLVTSFGAGYDRAKDVHRDTRMLASAEYFFKRPWMIESGITFNVSAPGAVFSHSQFLAIRQGSDKKHFITLRGEFGSEAYEIIGPNTSISDFRSHSVSLTWRQWMHAGWGVNVGGEYYSNPAFQRKGAQAGLFKTF